MPADPPNSPIPSRRPTSGPLTIGKVIEALEPDFPDLTVSKIRFLESEGLLQPARSGSGYRRYAPDDIERLRYILTAQRDHFWPLKVIREALAARDVGEVTPAVVAAPRAVRLTAGELAEQTGATPALVESLHAVGLIGPDGAGRFSADDQQIVEAALWLAEFGIEPRHLRPFRTAADREGGLVEQILAPSSPGRERATWATKVAQRLLDVHSALVSKGLAELR